MLVAGEWLLQPDGVTRPLLRGNLRAADGSWVPVRFVIDSGADQSALDANTVAALGIAPTPAGIALGIGGSVKILEIATVLRLQRADGGTDITLNGRFLVLPNPDQLDSNLVGREVLNLFTVILDRAADAIWLVRPSHRDVIV